MPKIELWPKQGEFVSYVMSGKLRHVVHVGGFGSGKTYSGAVAAWGLALSRPNSMGLIAAGTYRQLKDTMLEEFNAVGEAHGLTRTIRSWSKSDMVLTLRNGTIIRFRSMEAMQRILSINANWYWADQAEALDADSFRALDTRIRKGERGIGVLTCNPAYGRWFETFYSRLGRPDDVPIATENRFGQLQLGPKKSTGLVMRSTTLDNGSNPPEYAANLIDQYGGENSPYARRLIFGEDIPFGGIIYQMFRPALHVVDPFPIPDSWIKWGSIDFGFEHPFVYLLFAEDPTDGMIYIVAEHYARRKLLADHAREIRRIENQYPMNMGKAREEPERYSDHDAQDRYELASLGIGMTPARKDVHEGIMHVIRLLSPKPNGKTGVRFFSTCANLLQEIREYRWDPKSKGEVPYKGPTGKTDDGAVGDHAMDALRYGLFSRPESGTLSVAVRLDASKKPFGALTWPKR